MPEKRNQVHLCYVIYNSCMKLLPPLLLPVSLMELLILHDCNDKHTGTGAPQLSRNKFSGLCN